MMKFFRVIMLSINVGLIFALLLSYLSGLVNPALKVGVVIYYFGLGYPVILLLNIGFVFFWLYRRRWYFLFSLLAIGLGYKTLLSTVPVRLAKKEIVPPGTIKILSYNVGGFGFTHDYKQNAVDLLNYIDGTFPDIICLQEVTLSFGRSSFFNEESLFNVLHKYPYKASYYPRIRKYSRHGNFIFSKYPILRKGQYDVGEGRIEKALFADIKIEGKTIRVVTVHLNSFQLTPISNTLYDELSAKDQSQLTSTMKHIVKSIGKGAHYRGEQVQKLKEYLDECPFPIILAGDFNDTPGTFSYKKLSKGMEDAFVKNGSGLGATYNGNYPSFRIDYILYSSCLKSFGYQRHKVEFSDHYPISTYIDISKCK